MTSPRLSNSSLRSVTATTLVPRYDRAATRIGIVHIGPGAFHRAHQALYADSLLHTDPRWAICAISLRSPGLRDALAPQDGLYTLCELSAAPRVRVIGAIREVLVAAEDLETAFARFVARDTRIVTLTVTEKGYCLNADGALDESHPDIVQDLKLPAQPHSTIGLLAEALRRRRASGERPFAVVSCDNLADNGSVLRRALVAFAARLDDGLAQWIESEVAFPRTMVDSITPATDDALRQRVAAATGVTDAWPVQREAFTQWVIEDVAAMREADWSGVGVTLAADVGVYDRAKLRLLNGAHSTLAYLGLLRGHETVAAAMQDAPLARFVEQLMREDIAPSLGTSRGLDIPAYIDAVLTRFRNPGVRHQLSQIAWDGSKKLPVRLMGTTIDALTAGRPIQRLAMAAAAWMRFVARQAKAGVPITDPDADCLTAIGMACNGDAQFDVSLFAAMETVIPVSLSGTPVFRQALVAAYAQLGSGASALP